MAEYITKKQVIEWFSCYGHDDKQIRFEDLSFDIQNMIPEDVATVVHGQWVEKRCPIPWGDSDLDVYTVCLVCGCCSPGESNYCPNCGARMDLEE